MNIYIEHFLIFLLLLGGKKEGYKGDDPDFQEVYNLKWTKHHRVKLSKNPCIKMVHSLVYSFNIC